MVAANWNQPLSDGLELPTIAPTTTMSTMDDENINTSLPTQSGSRITPPIWGSKVEIKTSSTPVPRDTLDPQPLCGGPEVMTILAIGVDTFDDEYFYGLADVFRIVRINFVTPEVSVLAIPRDTWVEIPEISDHYGITQGKLNQSYFYGTKAMGYYGGPGEGPGLMALTLVINFNL